MLILSPPDGLSTGPWLLHGEAQWALRTGAILRENLVFPAQLPEELREPWPSRAGFVFAFSRGTWDAEGSCVHPYHATQGSCRTQQLRRLHMPPHWNFSRTHTGTRAIHTALPLANAPS